MHFSGVLSAFFFVLATTSPAISGGAAEPAPSPLLQIRSAAPVDSSQAQVQFDRRPPRLVAYPAKLIAASLTRLRALTGELTWLPKMKESLIWEDGAVNLSPSLEIDGTFGLQMKRRSFLMNGALLRLSLESGDRFDASDWQWRAHYTLKIDPIMKWLLRWPGSP